MILVSLGSMIDRMDISAYLCCLAPLIYRGLMDYSLEVLNSADMKEDQRLKQQEQRAISPLLQWS
jgi:hypothetical protein